MFLISLFNPYGAVSISIAISSLLSPLPYILSPRPWIFDCSFQGETRHHAIAIPAWLLPSAFCLYGVFRKTLRGFPFGVDNSLHHFNKERLFQRFAKHCEFHFTLIPLNLKARAVMDSQP